MTVKFETKPELDVDSLMHHDSIAIAAIAHALTVNAVEYSCDYVLDYPEEYPTHNAVHTVMKNCNNIAASNIDDFVDELRRKLRQYFDVMTFRANVASLHYDDMGVLKDIDVQFNFKDYSDENRLQR